MEIEGTQSYCNLIDGEFCILTVNKDAKTITIWQRAIDSAEEDAYKRSKKESMWLVIRHLT